MLTQSWHGELIGFNPESGWWLQGGKGAPVLLMHQEFLNGDSWFQFVDAKHVGRLLPVLLLDDGFDVWVGHQRATYWCHDHVSLHYTQQVPSSLSFLQFSSSWLYLTQRYTNMLNPPWTLLPSQHVGWFPDVRDACISMFNGLREDPWSSNHSWTLVFSLLKAGFLGLDMGWACTLWLACTTPFYQCRNKSNSSLHWHITGKIPGVSSKQISSHLLIQLHFMNAERNQALLYNAISVFEQILPIVDRSINPEASQSLLQCFSLRSLLERSTDIKSSPILFQTDASLLHHLQQLGFKWLHATVHHLSLLVEMGTKFSLWKRFEALLKIWVRLSTVMMLK